jgi:histidinol phosphatase-like enzyme
MAYEAKKDDKNIDFSKSIIIGDSESDMLFGKKLGMLKVGIGKKLLHKADIIVEDVYGFYSMLKRVRI